jgi:hypothetical protein
MNNKKAVIKRNVFSELQKRAKISMGKNTLIKNASEM